MAESPYIIDVNEENFVQIVMEGSQQVPVLVDFWADWCNPCQTLMPVLAKLAEEYQGAFILAKVNSDQNQNLSAQLGVRSLPTVKLFKGGQPVDEFMGAVPESEIRAFLDKHVEAVTATTPPDNRVAEAMQAFDNGDTQSAKSMLLEAYNEDQTNAQTALALGQVCMATGDYDSVELVLKNLSEDAAKTPEAVRLKGLLTLSQADTSEKDLATLSEELATTEDSETRYHYSVKLALGGQVEEAMDSLMSLMLNDREFADDGARKCLITLFDILGTDPIVSKYRRKMFNLLH